MSVSPAKSAREAAEGGSRRLILDTAARLLRSGGYHQTTLRENGIRLFKGSLTAFVTSTSNQDVATNMEQYAQKEPDEFDFSQLFGCDDRTIS